MKERVGKVSWIKKLFQLLKSKEEESDSGQPLHQDSFEWEEDIASRKMNQADPGKEMNAKVIYQYPKGQFRFPLIPDGETPAPRNRKRQAPKEYEEYKGKQADVEKKVEPVPISKNKSVEKPKLASKKIVKENNTPFRPTEIPSPIYGFGRPKLNRTVESREEQPIEFELETKELTEHQDVFEQQAAAIEHILTMEEESLSVQFDSDEHEPMSRVQDQGPEAEIPEPAPEDEQEPASGDQEPASEVEVFAPEDQESATEVQELTPEHQEAALEDQEPASDLQEHALEDQGTAPEMQGPSPGKEELEPEIREELDELTIPEEEEPKPVESQRKHIPFNVVMLKHDKQKLAEAMSPFIGKQEAPVMQPADPIVEKENTHTIQEEKPAVPFKNETQTLNTQGPTSINDEPMDYQFPEAELLSPPIFQEKSSDWIEEQEQLLNSTLKNFNVRAKVVNVTQGPSVTRFEVQPEPGVKVNKITNLTDDIKLSLAAKDIRMEAPIPGKHTIGIEVPNQKSRPVYISEIINSQEFKNCSSPLTAVLGLDIAGSPIVTDLGKMPHGLIAGATGSGKSVCINSILVSLLYKAHPDDLKLMLIDPKMVELAPYNRIPHLVSPVITDVKAATAALKWAVEEMEHRYELFAHTGVRDIKRFNEHVMEEKRYSDKLPYLVIVIDELADLMMMSPADVEEAICRIAQKARACGIHLIVATQRPSVDVITGLIKANIPTRIAFSVSSQVDSRTIIDISGAEKLLGRGDMLFLENGSSKPVRLQGTFVSDEEIDDVVSHVRKEKAPEYLFEQEELLKKAQVIEEEDELFYEACEYVVDQEAASTSSLQRRFKIGYNRAARLIDMMEQQGFISGNRGSKPREVLITSADLESLHDSSTNK
jgi:DNA segregation ATPase FtsK/SpoIIIE, S-DNA-T family